MPAHTPWKKRPVATPTDTDEDSKSDDGDDEEPPSLDDLADDELIRCQNPNYAFLTWFYELDSDGSLLTYHECDGFEVSAETDRVDGERSITADGVISTVVERDVLEESQRVAGGDA